MSSLQTPPATDTWIATSWNDYLLVIVDPAYEKAKGYYYRGHMRLEMSPVGFDHSTDHGLIALAINLFAIAKGIPLTLADNCSYRKVGVRECQPDLSCYIGDKAQAIPKGTNIVSLDQYPAPDLVIEVAKTTLLDDLGTKRSLYEDLGAAEYWVVDVQNAQVFAYAIFGDRVREACAKREASPQENRGSKRINESQVLPGLEIAVLEKALQLNRQADQSQVGAWLLNQFQEGQ